MATRGDDRWFWLIAGLLALVVGVFGYGVIRDRGSAGPSARRDVPKVLASDPIRGQAGAALTVIEYGDFECPFCRSEQPALKTFLAKYDPRVRLVWKDLPISDLHPESLNAAEAARCAQEQGAFWQMHDALFAQQEDLGDALYERLASELDLDAAAFAECRDSDRTLPLITESIESAPRSGVDGAPYYFFGDEPVKQLPSPDALDRFLQQ